MFARGAGDEAGFIVGSGAALPDAGIARARGRPRGSNPSPASGPSRAPRTRRRPGGVAESLGALWREAGIEAPDRILSGATGVAGITAEECAALADLAPGTGCRALGDTIGHGLEVVAPFGAALAAGLIAAGEAGEVAVTVVGHRRGEGVMRLVRT